MADMLNVAVSGMRAFQRALETTSHNIANATTPGYSRHRVNLISPQKQSESSICFRLALRVTWISSIPNPR